MVYTCVVCQTPIEPGTKYLNTYGAGAIVSWQWACHYECHDIRAVCYECGLELSPYQFGDTLTNIAPQLADVLRELHE